MKKKIQSLSAVLLTLALLLSALSVSAAAQQSPFALTDAWMVEYSIGERGLNFSDESAIDAVEAAFSGLTPTLSGEDVSVRPAAHTLRVWQDDFPVQFIFQDEAVLTSAKTYQLPQKLKELDKALQQKIAALDPYGYFTWSESFVGITVLNNEERYAVFEEQTENKILLLERLQSLKPQKISGSKREELGRQRMGASELRVHVTEAEEMEERPTYSYQFYDKGVSITTYNDDGVGITQYFSCDPEAVGSLTAQMQKCYDMEQQKSATWLAIVNNDRVDSFTVIRRKNAETSPLTGWNRAATIDLLRTLPVSQAEELDRLWTKPEVEYRIEFKNALTYRVQLLGGQVRIWASDMDKVLQFTVDAEKWQQLLDETNNRIIYERENIIKPNVRTG